MNAFCIAVSTQSWVFEMPEKFAAERSNMVASPSPCNAIAKFSCVDSILNFGNWTYKILLYLVLCGLNFAMSWLVCCLGIGNLALSVDGRLNTFEASLLRYILNAVKFKPETCTGRKKGGPARPGQNFSRPGPARPAGLLGPAQPGPGRPG